MNIIITNTTGIPIYEQIKEQIKSAVLSGELAEGDLLPSIRQLAKDLKISVITTMRAYNDLEQEGYVINVQGKGCYVSPKNPELLREQKLIEAEEHLRFAVESAKLCRLSAKEFLEILKMIMEDENYG